MNLYVERFAPVAAAALAGVAAHELDAALPSSPDKFLALLSATISVSAILVGFLATLKSILLALPHVVRELRKAGYQNELANYLSSATSANLTLCLLSVCGFFDAIATEYAHWYAVLWFLLGTYAAATFFRVTAIMVLLLKRDPDA